MTGGLKEGEDRRQRPGWRLSKWVIKALAGTEA